MKTKIFILFLLIFSEKYIFAQTKESVNILIDKTMHFYESQKDSIKINAERIRKEAKNLNLKQEELYYYRFMGFYYEYDNQPDMALKSYLKLLEESEKQSFVPEKYQAIGDLMNVYFNQNQQSKAKELLLKAINDSKKDNPKEMVLSTFYNNLGMVYSKENKLDSALQMYQKSLEIKNKIGDPVPIADLKNNMSALYLKLGNFKKAEQLTSECYSFHKDKKMSEDLWFDLVSFTNIYLETNRLSKALEYADKSLILAKELKSKNKEMESYQFLGNVYQAMGQFKQALTYEKKYQFLRDQILNESNSEKIAEIQEKYESEKKQRINIKLTNSLNQEKEKKQMYLLSLILSLLILGIVIYSFMKNKQKNRIINQKNTQLLKLNSQKNHLISMVSHDLKTPFLSIRALGNAWKYNIDDPISGAEFLDNILESSDKGLEMISKILESEKISETGLKFEKIELNTLVSDVISKFEYLSKEKQVEIRFTELDKKKQILTDESLLKSALQNVLSNALKFSEKGQIVSCEILEFTDETQILVRDNGPGFAINAPSGISRNTIDTHSSGIGLNIVKRIMNELGGSLKIESSSETGTLVILILPE